MINPGRGGFSQEYERRNFKVNRTCQLWNTAHTGMLFWTTSLPKGILCGKFFWARACFLAVLVKEKSNVGNSSVGT